MCGINGIYAYHYAANPVDREELGRTRDHMTARGPDGKGMWTADDSRIGLGHRRLSIIDLSEAGAQPMLSADRRLAVTFNGEIYNYRSLRQNLEAKGYVFRSHSDTEVLLHLYAEKGAEMVHDLRGMFAFAIWDERSRKLFLARDPYGIKPLYYADDGWTFRFASQVKALVAGRGISADQEPAGLVGFYLFGHVPEPFTLYREIRVLPAGTTLLVGSVGVDEPRRYHSLAQVYCEAEAKARGSHTTTPEQARATTREALLDSVRHHLIADVPVGAFLSGGIDSASLVALMRESGQSDIQTVTLTFREFQGRPEDEAPLAAEVAKLYETQHTTRVITESEFLADLPYIMEAMDQPSVDGINTWFVSKAASELGLKVAVSGLGGDELFGGYPSFRDIPRLVRAFGLLSRIPALGKATRIPGLWAAHLLGRNPKVAGLVEFGGTYAGAYLLRRGLFLPWELDHLLGREVVTLGLRRLRLGSLITSELKPKPGTAFARVSTLESALYMRNQLLRDTDWASMAHGLEVRVPLVDHVLLSKVAPFSSLPRKTFAKALIADAASPPLPNALRYRQKSGFTTPVAKWQQEQTRLSSGPIAERADTPWARRWALEVMAA